MYRAHMRYEQFTDGYHIRRAAIDNNIPLITNVQVAKLMINALKKWRKEELPVTDWSHFQQK